jgi:formylglycine-generating enzyme required for sulfatase activity
MPDRTTGTAAGRTGSKANERNNRGKGISPAEHCDAAACTLGTTSPVGRYPANRYGLFDMAGNVWEFTRDEWKPYPATTAGNPLARERQSREAAEFLQVTTRRVIRGGSFDGAPVNLWVDYRDSHPPNGSREFVGFRCAK